MKDDNKTSNLGLNLTNEFCRRISRLSLKGYDFVSQLNKMFCKKLNRIHRKVIQQTYVEFLIHKEIKNKPKSILVNQHGFEENILTSYSVLLKEKQ